MTWVVILAVGAGSYAFRLVPVLALQKVTMSERGERFIRHAGIAAITALIATSVKQDATGSALAPTLLAMMAAVVLAARGASMMLLLACGGGIYAGTVIVMHWVAR